MSTQRSWRSSDLMINHSTKLRSLLYTCASNCDTKDSIAFKHWFSSSSKYTVVMLQTKFSQKNPMRRVFLTPVTYLGNLQPTVASPSHQSFLYYCTFDCRNNVIVPYIPCINAYLKRRPHLYVWGKRFCVSNKCRGSNKCRRLGVGMAWSKTRK